MGSLLDTDIDLRKFEPYMIDCGRCCGLCCVALYFSRMDGFPEDKEAGEPCKNLHNDYKCRVHSSLSGLGLHGCMAYDCFGAGQKVTGQIPFKPDWNTIEDQEAEKIFQSFLTVMHLHQTLWYLAEASVLRIGESLKEQIRLLKNEGKDLTEQPLQILLSTEAEPFREKANSLLKRLSTEIASRFGTEFKPDVFKDYMGSDLRGKKLQGKDFSMALMIASNLERADLQGANFLGADMRDANIRNTDLSQSLFLTQIQINAAKGNEGTILPPYLKRPSAWVE